MHDVALEQWVTHGKNTKLSKDRPKMAFLDELVEWGRKAPMDIFESRGPDSVYHAVEQCRLGDSQDPQVRRAIMLEVMRVLAGHESTWKWNQGVDHSNERIEKKDAMTTEAGPWQVSANSMKRAMKLQVLVAERAQIPTALVAMAFNDKAPKADHARAREVVGTRFQNAMKSNHTLAMEYVARYLSFTTSGHGPFKHKADRRSIYGNLSRDAVNEFLSLLAPRRLRCEVKDWA
jgi:hypothetical protein